MFNILLYMYKTFRIKGKIMIFNSYIFILAFLPSVILGYCLIGNKCGYKKSLFFLLLASMFFMGIQASGICYY